MRKQYTLPEIVFLNVSGEQMLMASLQDDAFDGVIIDGEWEFRG